MRRKAIICAVLAAVTLAVYWPVRRNGFIDFDDPQYVVENAHVNRGLSWQSFKWTVTTPVVANWHPLTTLSHMVDCQVLGVNAGRQHWVNVGFHIANALLLFLVLNEMTRLRPIPARQAGGDEATAADTTWRCAMVAAVFAWHPLRVESVAWISERKDVLSGLFFMLTLLAYGKYVQSLKSKVQSPRSETKGSGAAAPPSWRYYALSLLFLTCGLMSKPMLVTVPFVLLLLDYWPLGRVRLDGEARAKELWPLLREKAPFFVLAAGFAVATFFVQRGAGAVTSAATIGLEARLDNAVVSYLRYLAKLVWPTRMAIIYPHPAARYYPVDQWPDWQTPLIALLLLAVTALVICQARRRPYLAVGWFWYLGMMVPVIGIIQVGEQAMADRYTYLPLIGPVLSLVWLASDLWKHWALPKPVLAAGTAAVLGGCAIVAHRQAGYWRDTVTLFEHAAAVTGGNPSAQFSIGVGLEKKGLIDLAMVRYRVAMAIAPRDQQIHYNLAQLLRKQGYLHEAADQYEEVLRLNPNDVPSHLNLAAALGQLGHKLGAKEHFEEALHIDPDSTEGLNNLAWLLATTEDDELRDGKRAVALAEHSCELTHYEQTTMVGTLAAAYAAAGRFAEAVATAERACRLALAAKDSQLAARNEELLALYRRNQPYRESTRSGTNSPATAPPTMPANSNGK